MARKVLCLNLELLRKNLQQFLEEPEKPDELEKYDQEFREKYAKLNFIMNQGNAPEILKRFSLEEIRDLQQFQEENNFKFDSYERKISPRVKMANSLLKVPMDKCKGGGKNVCLFI